MAHWLRSTATLLLCAVSETVPSRGSDLGRTAPPSGKKWTNRSRSDVLMEAPVMVISRRGLKENDKLEELEAKMKLVYLWMHSLEMKQATGL